MILCQLLAPSVEDRCLGVLELAGFHLGLTIWSSVGSLLEISILKQNVRPCDCGEIWVIICVNNFFLTHATVPFQLM